MRQVVLDTETTGISPSQGHRIIEIGCVELINRRLTGKTYQVYIQPDRKVDPGAVAVHGITNDFLKDKPKFKNIAEEFKRFIDGAELIIHNASFDVGFIEHEFSLMKDDAWMNLDERCTITDTLSMARQKHPGQRNNLDALSKRYNVDTSHRHKHGALLDAEILAYVYLAMTGGQNALVLDAQNHVQEEKAHKPMSDNSIVNHVVYANEEELAAHQLLLGLLKS